MTVEEILPLIRAYYQLPENGAGGWLHVVLDDGNIEDEFVRESIKMAETEGDTEAVRLGEMLLQLTEDEREALVQRYGEYAI
jgi:DNA-directed RNA polymerase specialized sigma24 family protein